MIVFSGGSSEGLKRRIEQSFDPNATGSDEFDLLITTDVLSEGVNLHRANALINYDLPWNPTRIMQRVGRINRIGTAHAEIFVFNFFPTAATKKHLSLEERILEKLQMFHETLGEDFKYLSEAENVSPKNLFRALTSNLGDDEINPELEYLEIIRQLRDEDKKLFERIKHLPKRARSGKIFSGDESTLTFVRSGELKTFFLSDSIETRRLSFIEAIELLRCEFNERRITIGEKFFEQYAANCDAFAELLDENQAGTINLAKLSSGVKTAVRNLKALARIHDYEEKIQRVIAAFARGDIPVCDTQRINQAFKSAQTPAQLFEEICNIVDERYLLGRQRIENFDRQRQVILSCSLKGG